MIQLKFLGKICIQWPISQDECSSSKPPFPISYHILRISIFDDLTVTVAALAPPTRARLTPWSAKKVSVFRALASEEDLEQFADSD